jgi:hypothetical protein
MRRSTLRINANQTGFRHPKDLGYLRSHPKAFRRSACCTLLSSVQKAD